MPAKQQLPWWVVTPLTVLWCVFMLFLIYREIEAWRARIDIRAMLDAPNSDFLLTVNGHPTQNPAAVLGAIRGIHSKAAHHSHPEHEIAIVVRRKQDVLELTLARDSDIQDEYWIFWTREEAKHENRLELGRIETSVFDSAALAASGIDLPMEKTEPRAIQPEETASRSWRSRILPVAIFGFFTLAALRVFLRLLRGEGAESKTPRSSDVQRTAMVMAGLPIVSVIAAGCGLRVIYALFDWPDPTNLRSIVSLSLVLLGGGVILVLRRPTPVN